MHTLERLDLLARWRQVAIGLVVLETAVVLVAAAATSAVPGWVGACMAAAGLGALVVLVAAETWNTSLHKTLVSESERLVTLASDADEERRDARRRRERIENVIEGKNYPSMVFQPIVDLRTMHTVGYESLSRFDSGAPDAWFAQAAAVGLGVELELKAARRALLHLEALPADNYMSVNCSSATLLSEKLFDLVAQFDGARIVIEITEPLPGADYRKCRAAVERLRALGVRLAIDDLGAGYASLSHVIELQPEIIKLDSGMSEVATPGVRTMVQTLVTLAGLTSATIIAEGLEDDENLALVRGLGVNFGQGWHLGSPQPLELAVESANVLTMTPTA